MTGIKGPIPDPYFLGGGLHEISEGGHLSMHADFNHHTPLNLERRINMLIYLNKDWKDEYGGQLELWDSEMTKKYHSIVPVFNRCVIFNSTRHRKACMATHSRFVIRIRCPANQSLCTTTHLPGTVRRGRIRRSLKSLPAVTTNRIGPFDFAN